MIKGKFIVLDGTDGSGKATQTKLLVKNLKKFGYKVKTVDFPRYEDNFFGKFIGECLVGDYGNFLEVDPHIASVLYAADRWESGAQIKKWLDAGNIVIADRYVSSNQIHQGGKIKDVKKRKKFLKWLEKMEFEIFKIPRPDIVIYLDVPIEITRKLLKGATQEKKYLKGKKDLSENSIKHARDSKESAIKLIEKSNNWVKVECLDKKELMSIEKIQDVLLEEVKKIVK